VIGRHFVSYATVVALIGAAAVGCSTNGQRNVFPDGRYGVTASVPAHVDEIQDLTVPTLHNNTDHPVRLLSVRIVGQPPAVNVLNVRAYNINMLGYAGLNSVGDLPGECPADFVPHLIGSFTIEPHKDSAWMIIVAFKISKPGVHHLRKLRISYSIDGVRGWQYMYCRVTSNVSNPPLPGARPEPRSAICGKD
jgi:hypothetical protein